MNIRKSQERKDGALRQNSAYVPQSIESNGRSQCPVARRRFFQQPPFLLIELPPQGTLCRTTC